MKLEQDVRSAIHRNLLNLLFVACACAGLTNRALLRLFCSCLLGGILGVGSASAETRLIFAGDTHFGENYQEGFAANGEGNVLVDEGYPWTIENFSAFLNSADVVIANLETAVTSLRAPVFPSKSYSHYADITLTPQTLAENNIRVVSLANNHALDYGDQGLVETLAALRAQGIASFGAGLDKAQAAAAHIEQFQVDGQDVTLPSGRTPTARNVCTSMQKMS